MMNKIIITVVLLTLSIAINVFSQDSILSVEVARTPTLAEGPVVDAQGNVYVSEPIRGVITRITPGGETSVWAELEGPRDHKILSDGTHLVCSDGRKAILRLDSNGKVIGEAATTCGDKPLRGPKDLVLDIFGGFYFTDPGHDDLSRVGYVDSTGQSHLVLESERGVNGIAMRGDGRLLCLADSLNNVILIAGIKSSGKLTPENVFIELPEGEDGKPTGVEGITFDDRGYLFVPQVDSGQVLVFNVAGHLIRSLPAGQENPTNIAFGPEFDQLYVAGGWKSNQEVGILCKFDLTGIDIF